MGKKIDLTGQRFGKWTVLRSGENDKWGGRRWLCECDCGNIKNVNGQTLRNGSSTNCGCSNKKDLTGQRFGKLVVIGETNKRNKSGKILWECLCDCGKSIETLYSYLKTGDTRSCGCMKRPDMTGYKTGNLIVLYKLEKKKYNGIAWLCQCTCGNTTTLSTGEIKSGNFKSCGCKRSLQLRNRKFGMLKVIKEHDVRMNGQVSWECVCDCGEKTIVRGQNLTSGGTKSCGCTSRIGDITGEKYGKLTALKTENKSDKHGDLIWTFECDCGTKVNLPHHRVRSGNTKSCGCYADYVKRSRVGEKNPAYNFNLTEEERNTRKGSSGKISRWSLFVKQRDSHKCECCGTSFEKLNAHHLNGWNAFPEQRFDTANGITLCEDCHKEFHHFNGYGNNTLEQFRDHIACTVGEEHISEIEEALLSRESEIIGQEQQTRELQTT